MFDKLARLGVKNDNDARKKMRDIRFLTEGMHVTP